MSDKNKAGVVFLILIAGMVALFLFTGNDEIKHPDTTVATLISFTIAGGKGIERGVYAYEVGGKQYKIEGYFNTTLLPGDKFKVKYERENPSHARIISYEPVFLEGEDISSNMGVIKKVGKVLDQYVAFEHSVGGITYFKVQNVNPDIELSDIKVGQEYRVIYLKEEPYRCYINLNKIIR